MPALPSLQLSLGGEPLEQRQAPDPVARAAINDLLARGAEALEPAQRSALTGALAGLALPWAGRDASRLHVLLAHLFSELDPAKTRAGGGPEAALTPLTEQLNQLVDWGLLGSGLRVNRVDRTRTEPLLRAPVLDQIRAHGLSMNGEYFLANVPHAAMPRDFTAVRALSQGVVRWREDIPSLEERALFHPKSVAEVHSILLHALARFAA